MKTPFTFLTIFLISITSFAQQGISYKALIKDDNGNVLANTNNVSVQFIIFEGDALSNQVYLETHSNVSTDANGIVITTIGNGTTSDDFSNINWGIDEHWLNVQIDIGDGLVDMGTTQFMAVPYAFSSADNLWQRNGEHAIAITENVGVGVSEPQSALHVKSHEDEDGIILQSDVGNNSSLILANVYPSNNIQGSNTKFSSNSGNLTISRYLGGGEKYPNLEILELTNTGEVIAPNANSYPSNYQSLMTRAASDNRYLRSGGNNDYFNVGIGNLEPQSLFEVAHQDGAPTSVNLTNAFSIRNIGNDNNANTSDDESWQLYTEDNGYLLLFRNGSFRGAFNATSGAYGQASDRRVKKDITALEKGTLNKVMQLNPVSYLMKDQTDTKRNLGLISQEVQELFPSITHYVKDSDVLSLSYTELIPVLIKALQEQQAIIEQQNAQIETLSTDNSLLKEKDDTQDKSIEALAARLNFIESKSSN